MVMAVQILFELNQELERLFVAGSRLAAGDPRIKKYIVPLEQYGEKSPVFQKLGGLVEDLLAADASDSSLKLIEAETFLLSILSTQGESPPSPDDIITDIKPAKEKFSQTESGYREMTPVVGALRVSGSGRMDILKDAYKKGMFNDPRLTGFAVHALDDKNPELAEYIADTILPSIGERAYKILYREYDPKGNHVIDGRRLSVMHKIRGREMLGLVDEAAANGSATVKTYAVRIMAEYPEYKDVLTGMQNESKAVREEVELALKKINKESRKGLFGKLFGKN
jgi:hypothetical protein